MVFNDYKLVHQVFEIEVVVRVDNYGIQFKPSG
jgi:hypothetical protein